MYVNNGIPESGKIGTGIPIFDLNGFHVFRFYFPPESSGIPNSEAEFRIPAVPGIGIRNRNSQPSLPRPSAYPFPPSPSPSSPTMMPWRTRRRTTTTAILRCIRRNDTSRDGPPTHRDEGESSTNARRIPLTHRDDGESSTNARRTMTGTSPLFCQPRWSGRDKRRQYDRRQRRSRGKGGRECCRTCRWSVL